MPPKTKSPSPKNSSPPPPPDIGIHLSKKGMIGLWITCLVLAFVAIFGYLFYKELHKQQVAEFQLAQKKAGSGFKNYTNDYWGFKFQYPSSWWPAIGSFEDGEYFFATEPINFAKELSTGQAMMEVKTYNNWKGLSFADWLSDMQNNYLAQGVVEQQNVQEFKNVAAIAYTIRLKKPINNTSFWNVLAVSKNQNVKYLFILESDNQNTAQKYNAQFQQILTSLEFYKGFGVD